MDLRPSVLSEKKSAVDSTDPVDALTTLSERHGRSRVAQIAVGIIILFVIALLIGGIIQLARGGASGQSLPSVSR
ncbi:MAG: hypothetical protein AAB573_01340 [Patescibacteria group bacterium]